MSEEESRNQVLAITLTELAFLITFILLFASVWTMRDSADTIASEKHRSEEAWGLMASLKDDNERLEEKIEKLQQEVDGFEDIVRRSTDGQADDFTHLVLTNAARAIALQDEVELLESQLEEADRSIREKEGELAWAQKELEQLSQSPSELQAQVVESTKRIEGLTGQVGYLQNRLGRGGLDYPPCWVDPSSNRVEYLFNVSFSEREFTIAAGWSGRRANDASQIEGVTKALGDKLTASEFGNRVMPILEWSKKQSPECRHFVRMIDVADSKSASNASRWKVEEFFYHYEVRGGDNTNATSAR